MVAKLDLWIKYLEIRLILKKGMRQQLTKTDFDKLNTREAWRGATVIIEEPRSKVKASIQRLTSFKRLKWFKYVSTD